MTNYLSVLFVAETILSSLSFYSAGSVLCSPDHPIRVTTRIEARVIVFNIDIPITVGFPVSDCLLFKL